MKRQLVDLQSRSMRSNLLFFDMKENCDGRQENCIDTVLQFCSEKLNIKEVKNGIKFDRARRIGRRSAQKPRPIIAKFNYYQDRESGLPAES